MWVYGCAPAACAEELQRQRQALVLGLEAPGRVWVPQRMERLLVPVKAQVLPPAALRLPKGWRQLAWVPQPQMERLLVPVEVQVLPPAALR